MNKLDRLNQLLAEYDLPEHKREVKRNFAGLGWLQKHLKNPSPELKSLLNMSQQQLLEEYVEQ